MQAAGFYRREFIEVNSKSIALEVLSDNKVTNLKHQITNKSQITIFNDRNTHHSRIVSLRKPGLAGDDAIGQDCKGIIGFEFGSLGFV
ncbi:MAG: hypothetical protein PVG84_13025 [Desulfobacterales bacterium]